MSLKNNCNEEIIQNIKDCGQALIDNAENIANDYKYMSDLIITCYVAVKDEATHVVVEQKFYPEDTIKRFN